MSRPVARSAQSTSTTSARAERNDRAPSSPCSPRRSSAQCRRATTTGWPGAPPYTALASPDDDDRAASSTRATTSAPTSGVSTVCSTAIVGVDRRQARTQRGGQPVGPVGCDDGTGRRRHVDDRGAQHHDDVVAAAPAQRGDRGYQPLTLCGKHFGHTEPRARSGGEQHTGSSGRHVNSVGPSVAGTNPHARYAPCAYDRVRLAP